MYIAPATKLEEKEVFNHSLHHDQSHQTKALRDYATNADLGSQLTISQVQFSDDMNKNTLSPQNKAPRHNSNAANIFRVKHGPNSQKKDKVTYIRYENYTSARSRKTTEQKIYQINNFVKKLTQNINKEDEMPQISQTKFRALKKIIEYYDIKNLDKSEYTNVIKSFGLQIGQVKAESKHFTFSEEKKIERKFKPISTLLNRTEKQLRAKQILDMSNQRSLQQNCAVIMPVGRISVSERKEKKREALINQDKMEQGNKLFNSLQMRKSKLKERSTKKHFKFNSGDNCIIQKINKFREFLFVLNFSNKIYRSLDLEKYPQPIKYYVGRGNNSNLIRSLMKKRFWFQEVSSDQQANFIWTQIKVPHIFAKQASVSEQQITPKPVDKKIFLKGGYVLNKGDPLQKILYGDEFKEYSMLQEILRNKSAEAFEERIKLCHRQIRKQDIQQSDIIHNHMPGNGLLGNKKAMFYCLKEYYTLKNQDVFSVVPLTFIINQGLLDPEYNRMAAYFNDKKSQKKQNFWILKPGQFSNRGNGIQCTNKLQDIRKRVNKCAKEKKKGSIIVQQYIVRPLLYNGRKFDIRTYMMITYHNGKTKAYWYQEGYVRTSSHFFSLSEMSDSYIHLTNDAVQQHSDTYGRFEEGNKLSYPQLQRYLDSLPANGRNLDFHQVIVPQMKGIAANAVKSTFLCLNKERKDKNFELFGLDFMIDDAFKPWLIQINTNPCLELASPVLERILPYMVQNLLRITVDTMFPPPDNFSNTYKYNIPQNSLHYNKFQLIFDSDRDGKAIIDLYKGVDVFKQLEGMQEDKNEYKKQGDLINVDDL